MWLIYDYVVYFCVDASIFFYCDQFTYFVALAALYQQPAAITLVAPMAI